MLEERIKNLEINFSHQENIIDQLNQVLVEQMRMIEALQREMLELKLSQPENSSEVTRTLADDVPPHY